MNHKINLSDLSLRVSFISRTLVFVIFLLNDKLKTIHHILFANFNRLQWMLYLALNYKSKMRIIFLYLYFMVLPKLKLKILRPIYLIKHKRLIITISNNSWYIISDIGIQIVKMQNLCFVVWSSCHWHYTSWIVVNGPFADYLKETL